MTRNLKIATLVAAVALLPACGASSPASNQSQADLDACVEKAKVFRDSKMGEEEPTVAENFDASTNAGKSVWVINAARVPFLQRISDGVESAADVMGLESKVVYGDGSIASAQTAVEQAIAQNADGIILVVVDPTAMERTIEKAAEAGIVVIDMINRSQGQDLPPGMAGTMSLDLKTEMEATVGWILADSGCEANLLMYSPSSLPITVDAAEETQKAYEQLCPWCEFELKDLDYGGFSSTLTGEVETDVRRKPDMTHIYSPVGSTIPYVEAGLRSAGSDIAIVTHDGLEDNLAAMRDGDGNLAADFAFAPTEAIGWQAIDQISRLLAGNSDFTEVIIPSRLLDESNVGASDDEAWAGFADYESVYEEAWTE